ncbi:uncharacterized protein MONBRDRAFT_26645 [Monosiga brevicollis MX1]|uniref:Enolase-phosphatase E1 n=1 Tax=Monosiga brevicollis TaxID=81824 RepID=ENOPH_MONBE|nr:uncharacterized protein MONBRDRAFT_26645 [Monosiga brevicollis MX1]A9V2Y9.1 RecName: Full=Enolase-phosphatase E1; AltName: Full=2,3-diketo-5-methylthio-1-phosphopentane phosphatase [Monosiga brevicollis]EDQ87967.1 predicted protein [Monosiga brevicollis MX1]|eukprot:XP_001747043.1 hypothetical protein [Monosiga brevicollis MX1]
MANSTDETATTTLAPAPCFLFDIEGTTTSISFVHEVLFPYARNQVEAFLAAHWDTDAVKADVDKLREQVSGCGKRSVADEAGPKEHGAEAASRLCASRPILLNLLEKIILTWPLVPTAHPLLELGHIWKDAYTSGNVKGHIYEDVVPAFQRLTEAGAQLYIYSSGSIAAQKLLFGHSEAGDLQPYLSGYFDTTTGPKRDAASYSDIAAAIGVTPQSIIFLSDRIEECRAASAAAMRTALVVRPGNAPLSEAERTEFPILHDFTGLRGAKFTQAQAGDTEAKRSASGDGALAAKKAPPTHDF